MGAKATNRTSTHLELTIAALLGRRSAASGGRREARVCRREKLTKNLPFSVSLRIRSTALCVARRSAVFARRVGLRFGGSPPPVFVPAPSILPSVSVFTAEVGVADEGGVVVLVVVLLVADMVVSKKKSVWWSVSSGRDCSATWGWGNASVWLLGGVCGVRPMNSTGGGCSGCFTNEVGGKGRSSEQGSSVLCYCWVLAVCFTLQGRVAQKQRGPS
ncbi:hypothetical protein FB451DRAFT_1299024 [Mycena latifolia]|nr:hypothetical protein FB451DRAFT_1299024 [Mycena latifolia]